MTTPICVVDIDPIRHEAVKQLVASAGGSLDMPSRTVPLRVIGHQPDVCMAVGIVQAFAALRGTSVEATVVVYRGGGFTMPHGLHGWHRFPHLLDRGRAPSANNLADLKPVIEWLVRGGDIPTILRPSDELLAPLVPLGVMIDGYLALDEASQPIPAEWFTRAVTLSRQAQARGHAITSTEYWTALGKDEHAINRLQRILDATEHETQGFREVLAAAREQWPKDPSGMCRSAALSLQGFWRAVNAGKAVARDEVAQAHVAFQLLAAVHL